MIFLVNKFEKGTLSLKFQFSTLPSFSLTAYLPLMKRKCSDDLNHSNLTHLVDIYPKTYFMDHRTLIVVCEIVKYDLIVNVKRNIKIKNIFKISFHLIYGLFYKHYF